MSPHPFIHSRNIGRKPQCPWHYSRYLVCRSKTYSTNQENQNEMPSPMEFTSKRRWAINKMKSEADSGFEEGPKLKERWSGPHHLNREQTEIKSEPWGRGFPGRGTYMLNCVSKWEGGPCSQCWGVLGGVRRGRRVAWFQLVFRAPVWAWLATIHSRRTINASF